MNFLQQLYEKYYSDHARDDMPDEDFAGPHKSFPIKDAQDVKNAAHLIGHADDPEAVKRRIIAIARRKGLTAALPDEWKDGGDKQAASKESAPPRATLLVEALDLSEAAFSQDGVLHDVVLIRAGMSKNRRHYSERLLQQAAPVFEGAKAYNDHAKQHKATDITGWYKNVRFTDGKLLADRHFAPTQAGRDVQALAQEIVAGRAPADLAGLSINAAGKVKATTYTDGDGYEVESISAAESVDDVATPAAGGSYLAASADAMTSALLQAMSYEEFLEARPDYVERLRKDFKRVRQDDALKTAQAVTQRLQDELDSVQEQADALTQQRDTALAERDQAQRALAVEQALAAVKLPAAWKADLRKQLQEADPETWASVLQTEIDKAGSAERKRVPVTGAGQQVTPSLNEGERTAKAKAPNWNEILSSPASFAAFQERVLRETPR